MSINCNIVSVESLQARIGRPNQANANNVIINLELRVPLHFFEEAQTDHTRCDDDKNDGHGIKLLTSIANR